MSPPVEQITITSLADEIAFRIQGAILAGEHPPGTHLFQDELCERFGVSRTPVREALRKLQAKHLVVLVPNKGATVRVPSREELIDVYNVRAELEGYACELASAHVSPALLHDLDAATVLVTEAVTLYERDGLPARGGLARHTARPRELRVSRGDRRGLRQRAAPFADRRAAGLLSQGLRLASDGVGRRGPRAQPRRARTDPRSLATGTAARARKEMRNHILHASQILLDYLDRLQFWQ